MIYQRTIAQTISATGVGLHSGCRVKLTLKPAPVNHGIVFVRSDLPNLPQIKSHPFLVNDTRLSSTLVSENNVRVATIEHLMSAFACFGIDNVTVELNAPEIPIMDGSSNSFLYLLDQAQVIDQASAKKQYIKIIKPIEVAETDKIVSLVPFDGYKLKISLEYDHLLFKAENSVYEVDFSKESYVSEISRARTFAFMYEIEYIRKNGLGQGGNLNNAIVVDDESVLNPDGLRFPNEFVRHKILDAIGDLYIAGHQIIGAFSGSKSGHAINNKLLRKLLNTPDAFEYVSFDLEEQVPNSFHHI